MMQRPFIGNLLTSDPVRYARNVAVLEAEPALGDRLRRRWPGSTPRSAMMRTLAEPGYPGKIRQPMLMVAAGQDSVVSTPAIDAFRRAAARRLAPRSCRARGTKC